MNEGDEHAICKSGLSSLVTPSLKAWNGIHQLLCCILYSQLDLTLAQVFQYECNVALWKKTEILANKEYDLPNDDTL